MAEDRKPTITTDNDALRMLGEMKNESMRESAIGLYTVRRELGRSVLDALESVLLDCLSPENRAAGEIGAKTND